MEVVAQNIGIAALHAARHRLADEGKCLVAVEAAQLDDFAVQLETVIGESRLAKTDVARIAVDYLASAHAAEPAPSKGSGFADPTA